MDLKAQTRACIALWILLKLGLCWAFDVHISDRDQPGKVLYNASLPGPGRWDYRLNPVRSAYAGQQLVGVDSFHGHLVLLGEPSCALFNHNPFVMVIDIRTRLPQSYTGVRDVPNPVERIEIPLNIYVHGTGCPSSRAAKIPGHHHHKRPRTRNQIKVSVSLGSNEGACLDKGFQVLDISKTLPIPSNDCTNTFRLSKSHPLFKLSHNSGSLLTTQITCFYPNHQIITGSVMNTCKRVTRIVPFKISIVAQEDRNSAILANKFMTQQQSQAGRKHPPTRSRRSANPPMFPQRLYVKNVPEEHTPCCWVVGTFTVIDPDSHHVNYELLPTRDRRSLSMFTIDPTSGTVTTTQPLNRESIQVHNFSIIATNINNRFEKAQAALTIYVDDINDHAPQFESDSYPQAISESISIGATVLTVHASDEDTGPNAEIEYSILNPSGPNEVFRIHPRTGSIYTHGLLDRETQSEYRLQIRATDKAPMSNRKSATSEVVITILDENDNRPQFTQGAYTVKVRENKNYGQDPVIATITAKDRDEGANGMVRYSITGGNNQNIFAIDAASGALTLLQPLDYERTSNYRLIVRAQDNGQPRKSNTTNVIVQVEDVNDNMPIFTTGHLQESILENEPKGHTITRVQAFDADDGLNADLIYTLIEASDDLPFSIDKNTGILKTNAALDREKQSLYFFKIQAVDQGDPPKSATASVQITIRDVNDNAPIFKPKLYSEIVSEEAAPGTPVVSVTAVDRDENENSQVSYAISEGNDGHAFNIIRQMGQGLITVARTLNYKEQSRFVLSVTASDPGGLVDTALVYINVSDANTFRPVFAGTPYQVRVDEDTPVGASVYKVVAFDNDVGENARITYVMGDNEAFQINPVSGDIIIKHPLDREKLGAYTVSVTANDNGRPSKSDTADVEILVSDVNDNSPVFLKSSYSGRIREDAQVGTSILTISAKDDDDSRNGMVRYTFERGDNGGGDFKLDPTLGILRIAKELDRERKPSYHLKAFAVDRGIPERSTSVVVNIQIEDINDNAPWFEAHSMIFDVNENSPIKTEVAKITATDPDDGVNAEVEYTIVGGADADSFSLSTGPNEPATIKTLVELDYESGKTQYTIKIEARSFHLVSYAEVIINVIDVNDNVPELKDFVIIFNNFRNHFPTGEIGQVPASDPDVNDVLRYKFSSGNTANVLHLNEETGMIRLDSRLNSDVPTNGTLQVTVSGRNTFYAKNMNINL